MSRVETGHFHATIADFQHGALETLVVVEPPISPTGELLERIGAGVARTLGKKLEESGEQPLERDDLRANFVDLGGVQLDDEGAEGGSLFAVRVPAIVEAQLPLPEAMDRVKLATDLLLRAMDVLATSDNRQERLNQLSDNLAT